MEIRIRNASKEEAGILAEIEAECFPKAEAASFEEIKERMEAFLDCFFVAETEGKIVGFINGGVTDKPELPDEFYHNTSLHKPEGGYQTVFGLDVLPAYRHRKIAGNLLDFMVSCARKQGKKGVILTCKEHLIHFYEGHGFVNYGISGSEHGGAGWHDLRNLFEKGTEPHVL